MQSDLAAFGGWCFLAGVFLMVAGDGLTTFNEPIPAEAWPWLYLVPLVVSFLLMAIAGRISPGRPARAALVSMPLAVLIAAFALSTAFSQDRTLSGFALTGVIGIAVFWWCTAHVLEDTRLADATWTLIALAVFSLAARVIAYRLVEGLDQVAFHIPWVAWLGKLQIAWVFNLCAPLLLARLIGESRRPYAIFNGIVWATVGVANHLLLSRMGSLVFMLTTVAVCLLNLAYWRRWILVMGAAVVGGTLLVANNLRTTIQVATGFFDRAQNPGIDRRLRLWEDAWRLFLTHPVAGTGIGTFDEMAYRLPDASSNPYYRGSGWHAHNVPLHVLSETGVLGLAAWVFLWAIIIRALLRAWKNGTQRERLFGSAALISVASFHLLSMTEVLIGARVHGSLRMNLTVALLVAIGLRMSLRAPVAVDHAKDGSRSGAMLTGSA